MITISNEGIFNDNNERIPETEIPFLLPEYTKFSDDLKFYSFFNLLLENQPFIDKVFRKNLGEYSLLDFSTDYNKPSDVKKTFTLRVGWVSILYPDGDLILVPEFDGYEKINDEVQSISIEFVPLCQLRMLNLTQAMSVKILDPDNPVLNGKEKIIIQAFKGFTLFEIIQAVLNEVSYHGTPDERDESLNNLNAEFDEITNKIKSGEIKQLDLKEFDKVILEANLKSYNDELQQYIDNEEYEKAAELKKEIEKLTNKLNIC